MDTRSDAMTSGRRITLTFTKEIVNDAVRTYVWRRGVVGQKILWAVEAAMVALFARQVWNGEQGWLVGFIGSAILLPPGMIAVIWITHYRNTVGKLHKLKSRRADFCIHDMQFEIISELGGVRLPWTSITEIWGRPGYWMLFTDPNQFMTLPLKTISEADRELLCSRLSSTTRVDGA